VHRRRHDDRVEVVLHLVDQVVAVPEPMGDVVPVSERLSRVLARVRQRR
jgi:hypothetical protein